MKKFLKSRGTFKDKYKLIKLTIGLVSVLAGATFGVNQVSAEEVVEEQLSEIIGTVEDTDLTTEANEVVVDSEDQITNEEVVDTSNEWKHSSKDEVVIEGLQKSNEKTVEILNVPEGEREILFNENWRVYKGDHEEASSANLDDTSWQEKDLPDDFSLEEEYSTEYEAESGFKPGGTQWYRKSFVVPEKYQDKSIRLHFDGSYMETELYVNDNLLATHNYGYTPFGVSLTDSLIKDGVSENVLAVKVTNDVPSSRWYSGSGIFRDVTLSVTDKVHVDMYGTKITSPELSDDKRDNISTNIQTTVMNESDEKQEITIHQRLLDKDGNLVKETSKDTVEVQAGERTYVEQNLVVDEPTLWSLDNPYMYKVETVLERDGEVIDKYETDYGYRYYNFDRDTGFSLNSEKMKLKGVNMHHDQGSLGAVANPTAINRQVSILKEMGANAIRVAHNPAATALIDACNKQGMLVIDEAFDGWTNYKNGNVNDFGRFFNEEVGSDNNLIHAKEGELWHEFVARSMVRRGRNAPSIILWSIGNEITEGAGGNMSHYPELAKSIISAIKSEDTTRPVTIGDNRHEDPLLNEINDIITEAGGIVGKNYKNDRQMAYNREQHPNWTLYASETASAIHSRGVYNVYGRDDKNLQMSSYDNNHARVGWGASASESWRRVIENDWNAGEFVWTGFDYLGEPTPWNGIGSGSVSGSGATPNSSFFGIVDTAGFPKDTYYLYRSMWRDDSDTLHLMSTWNDEEIVKDNNGQVQVDVFTNADRVELYLNGELVGEQTAESYTTDAGYTYQRYENGKTYPTFNVDWQAGELTTKAYKDGVDITDQAVGRKSVKTSGDAYSIKLKPEKESLVLDKRDLVYVEVDVYDKDGNFVPGAKERIHFTVEGPAKIVGVDNGNPADMDPYVSDNRNTFNGKALVILQGTKGDGKVTLTATAEGLEPDTITIDTKKPKEDDKLTVVGYDISTNYYMTRAYSDNLQMPETITIRYSNGTSKEVPVSWEDISQTKLSEIGEFTVAGSVDYDITPVVNVSIIEPFVGVENYSTYTYENRTPELPNTLRSIDVKGDFAIDATVEWDIQEGMFAKVGQQVVNGTATVFGQQVPVTATVRVIPAREEARNILRLDEDPAFITNGYEAKSGELVDYGRTPISDSLDRITNGITDNHWNTQERWTNWSIRNNPEVKRTYLQFEWDKPYTFNNINMWHYTDSGSSTLPGAENVSFDYWDNETSEWINVEASNITQVSYNEGVTPYGLIRPVTTDKFRVWLQGPELGDTVGLTEIEILSYSESMGAREQVEIDKLQVNGKEYDVSKGKIELELAKPLDISLTELHNAAVTIIPLEDGNYKILLVPESKDKVEVIELINSSGKEVDLVTKVEEILKDDGRKLYKDDDTKVQVSLNQADATNGLKLKVRKLAKEKVAGIPEYDGVEFDLYDIEFVDENGNVVHITKPALVTLPVNGMVDKVYYTLLETGITESLAFTQIQDKVSFVVDHFSVYGVVYVKEVVKEITKSEKVQDTLVVQASENKITETSKTTKKLEELTTRVKTQTLPETGEKETTGIAALATASLLAGLIVVSKRKKEEAI